MTASRHYACHYDRSHNCVATVTTGTVLLTTFKIAKMTQLIVQEWDRKLQSQFNPLAMPLKRMYTVNPSSRCHHRRLPRTVPHTLASLPRYPTCRPQREHLRSRCGRPGRLRGRSWKRSCRRLMVVSTRPLTWCMLELLTRRSQEVRREAGRKGRLEGSPVEHRDPGEGSSDSPAGHMGLEEGSSVEAQRTVRRGLQRVQLRVQLQEQQQERLQERLQPCARHQSHLQPCVSVDRLLVAITSSLYIPRAFIRRAPPARPAAAPPAPYSLSKMLVRCDGNVRFDQTLTHLLPPLSFSFLPDSAARAASEPAGGGLLPASP